jgi:hypothetical protein
MMMGTNIKKKLIYPAIFMVIFHSYVNGYQRIVMIKSHLFHSASPARDHPSQETHRIVGPFLKNGWNNDNMTGWW